MHLVPAYLRPVSILHVGTESHVDQKAEAVESIECQSPSIDFMQREEMPHWRYREILDGKRVIERGDKVIQNRSVDHPDRHWWILSRGLFEDIDPVLRSHADIFDFLLALNICIDDPVFFSQNPGQVLSGVFKARDSALEYRNDLSPGSFPLALLASGEIPVQISVERDVSSVYDMVRTFRSMRIGSNEDMDIRIALHVYDDALSSTIWTSMANYYYVCENLLCSGHTSASERDRRFQEATDLSRSDVEGWRNMVNRIKHPDKGESVIGLIESDELPVPSVPQIRETTNAVLVETMTQRYEALD